jgi:hypothetical protein
MCLFNLILSTLNTKINQNHGIQLHFGRSGGVPVIDNRKTYHIIMTTKYLPVCCDPVNIGLFKCVITLDLYNIIIFIAWVCVYQLFNDCVGFLLLSLI